jgi:uncharacterized protein YjlB
MREEFRALMREGRIALGIGVSFLIVCVTAGNALAGLLHDATWADIARETLSIGGWVAMWRPMQIYLYDWWPLKTRERLYRRMARMHVRLRQPGRNAVKAMAESALALPAGTKH